MTASGRKKRRADHFQPHVILGRSSYKGLRATVNLLKQRQLGKHGTLYTRARRLFDQARTRLESSDLSYNPLSDVEPNIRKAFLEYCWKSTVPYGNEEFKRVYDWRKGTVGPLNSLFNYAGARLRDLAVTQYPFPEPEFYQVWRYADGTVKVHPKRVIDRLESDGTLERLKKAQGFTVSWRAGYPGTRDAPRYFLAHPTLPSLDFVDMIRTHVFELCRQCFRLAVPVSVAHRYIRLLIHRLRPFLDYIYTRRETGEPHFYPRANSVLGELVREMRSLYARDVGVRTRASRIDRVSRLDRTVGLLRGVIKEHLNGTENDEERRVCQDLLNKIDTEVIVDRDVEKMVEQVIGMVSEEGTRWHRILLSGLHHPRSLRQVIFSGDMMVDTPSSVIVVAELPLNRRQGQVDLALFIRRRVREQNLWTPVMVLEVKTKGAFDLSIFGVRSNRSKKDRCLPATYVWRRPLNREEWNALTTSSVRRDTIVQLETYQKAILTEYRALVPFDEDPPTSLWKGVLVVDPTESPENIYQAFHALLNELVTAISLKERSMFNSSAVYTLPATHGPPVRVALKMLGSSGPDYLLSQVAPPARPTAEDPFVERREDERFFTLYISLAEPTSGGVAGAWLAQLWHLLHHVQECRGSDEIPVYWLDLLGTFRSERLRHLRFALRTLFKERQITRVQYDQLSRLVGEIVFTDLSKETDRILRGDAEGIDSLIALTSIRDEGEKIIIVDGWRELEAMVLPHHRTLVQSLELRLLDSLPTAKTDLIWTDGGQTHTLTSVAYQRECIVPLRYDSPRRRHIDQILYNLPLPSRSFGSLAPAQDNLRIIVEDVPTKSPPWMTIIHVPYLTNATQRFAGLSSRDGRLTRGQIEYTTITRGGSYHRGVTLSSLQAFVPDVSEVERDAIMHNALALVPSVTRPRTHTEDDEHPTVPDRERPILQQSTVVSKGGLTLTERLRFVPTRPPPRPSRLKGRYVDQRQINARWLYETNPLYRQRSKPMPSPPVRRPPLPSEGVFLAPDTERCRVWEVRRLRSAARFLQTRPVRDDLREVLRQVLSLCSAVTTVSAGPTVDPLKTLRGVRNLLSTAPATARIWEHIRPLREELVGLLNTENRAVIQASLEDVPDLFLLYGNNLFLMMLVAAHESRSIHYETLWRAVGEWTLYQLGLRPECDTPTVRYDLHTVYEGLRSRAGFFQGSRIPAQVLSTPRTGQLIWTDCRDMPAVIIVFPHRGREVVSALLTGITPERLGYGWFKSENNPILRESAHREALTSPVRTPVYLTRVEDQTVLWISDGEEEPLLTPFILKYGRPDSERHTVPWVSLSSPYGLPLEHLVPPPVFPVDETAVDAHLR
ncbi:MAG: hypothetical protein DRO87_05025, partial [Candidatus Thorarchaeota archaeon]